MTINFSKYTDDIRDSHLGMLLDSVEDRSNYRDVPEFCDAADDFCKMLDRITDDVDTMSRLVQMLDAVIYIAKYQGFKNGFHEAAGLLTEGAK